MAKYDYGGGCPCGLYRECIPQCEHYVPQKKICTCGPYGYCTCDDKKEKQMSDEIDDFGFTLVDEKEVLARVPADPRAEKLRSMIMPLLLKLKANPDKDMIKWGGADRVKQIDEFIAKINKVVDGT